ncbi:putative opsin 1 protein [Rosellinia necatrix]|uniref:Putative opsin 1 protein n=1 Tax=Rosellinia necatrix TaxID=77044 RepID=A0A1W2TMJ1_ROSNE|nr:putative opsin 1 protein [Rosellinia necatrix]
MMMPQDIFDQVAAAVPTSNHRASHTSTLPFPTVTHDIPKVYHQYSTEVGHKALWVVCVLMGISSLAFYAMAMRVPVQKRLFHILTASITTFAFLSYYAMATGAGVEIHTTAIKENKLHVITEVVKRQVYWARYVDWSLTTPLLLLDLSLLAGLNGASILVLLVSDVIMILTGLFAAFSRDQAQGWGWYAFACLAYLNIVYQLGYKGRAAVAAKDNKTRAFFGAISLFTLLLWTLYPIVWGVADGARIVNVDGEIIAYAVLDILAKPVFGFWLLLTHDAMSRTSPSIGGFWAHGLSTEGTLRVGDGHEDA